MKKLNIDLETRSTIDLISCGVYRYVEQFELLIFGYCYDGAEVQCIDVINGGIIPPEVIKDIFNPNVLKIAHNANFERVCLGAYFKSYCEPEQWLCTAGWAAYTGLPRSLKEATKAAQSKEQKKITDNLIRKFCIKSEAPVGEDWETFKEYNKQDVRAEMSLIDDLQNYPWPEYEKMIWYADQRINDKGFLIDKDFVEKAQQACADHRDLLLREAVDLTHLKNPNSVKQLKGWLNHEGTLNKKAVILLLKDCTDDPTRTRVLKIRQEMALSSVSKFEALVRSMNFDGRVRGTLLYHGAHTGRWTGKRFQPQNLPRATVPDYEMAHEMVKNGELAMLDFLYGDRMQTMSCLVRSSLTANKFLFALDFSQIEARVCAWMAGETWIEELFKQGAKAPYYEATASKMWGVPMEGVTKELRQKGKTAALLLQYGGSLGALARAGVVMSDEEMQELVNLWRRTCPRIVQFWYALDNAALKSVAYNAPVVLKNLQFRMKKGCLCIDLPSGRALHFRNAVIVEGKYGSCVQYDMEFRGKVIKKETYGGLWCENVTQAISRDLLAELIVQKQDSVVMHVHDEIVLEDDEVEFEFKTPAWCAGLNIDAVSYKVKYYRKD